MLSSLLTACCRRRSRRAVAKLLVGTLLTAGCQRDEPRYVEAELTGITVGDGVPYNLRYSDVIGTLLDEIPYGDVNPALEHNLAKTLRIQLASEYFDPAVAYRLRVTFCREFNELLFVSEKSHDQADAAARLIYIAVKSSKYSDFTRPYDLRNNPGDICIFYTEPGYLYGQTISIMILSEKVQEVLRSLAK